MIRPQSENGASSEAPFNAAIYARVPAHDD
jgi:hypothetical protein